MADISTEETDLFKLKVVDLKELLEKKGLSTTGKKAELCERLQAAEGDDVQPAEGDHIQDEDDTALDDILNDTEEAILEDVEKENVTVAEKEVVTPAEEVKVQPKQTKTLEKIVWDSPDTPKAASPTDETAGQKLVDRAKRFGVSAMSADTKKPEVDVDKLKKRAERFGTVTSPTLTKVDADEKKKARAERFGITADTVKSTSTAVDSDKMKARADKFGKVTSPILVKTVEEEEKVLKRKAKFDAITAPGTDAGEAKRKRAERFQLS